MYQEILSKKKNLDSRKPYAPQMKEQIKKSELCEMIYTLLRLDGSNITKEQVVRILEGEFIVEATVSDHFIIKKYIQCLLFMDDLLAMDSEISYKILEQFYEILSEGEGTVLRMSNPTLYTLDYNPPHWKDIEHLLKEFIKWSYEEAAERNPLLRAAYLHNKLFEIYPFELYSEAVARLVMYYSLLRDGYPIFELRLSEREYNTAVMKYLNAGDIQPFYGALERSIYNRLDILLQMTAED
ncbi:Fic family protein [Clostridium aminobutyricum]|uniref:Fic family protein n=1 Tax=Clostridium aminobutyricum TaxID=33953 RepID=A0A939D912_CLOAM|nr:Fic family protein [Clostridium aminobutyricum]MBN7772938.1 Fic family protein [Clostridium aminobutyricum]